MTYKDKLRELENDINSIPGNFDNYDKCLLYNRLKGLKLGRLLTLKEIFIKIKEESSYDDMTSLQFKEMLIQDLRKYYEKEIAELEK